MESDRTVNFGIIAHVDAGKTTVTERILKFAKKIHKIGEVHHGEATMDWMTQEKERGITIQSAATFFEWSVKDRVKTFFNLIDTPGHVDFTLEVERSLRVLDSAVIILDGVEGVEPQTRTVWEQASRHNVKTSFFINKLDRMGANFKMCLDSIENNFKIRTCPLFITFEDQLYTSYDLLNNQTYQWDKEGNYILEEGIKDLEKINPYYSKMMDSLAEVDETIMEHLLMDSKPSREELVRALRFGMENGLIYPLLSGSALKNIGVQPLLDCAAEIFVEPKKNDGEKLKALIFKIQKLPTVGLIYYLRIFQGHIKKGDKIFNLTSSKRCRVTKLVRMHAISMEEVQEAKSGDIVAVFGVDGKTGDTISCSLNEEPLFAIETPESVLSVAVQPDSKSNKDFEKLGEAIKLLVLQDPSLRVSQQKEGTQKILGGMGELHLQVAVSSLEEIGGFKILTSEPKVEYKSTLVKKKHIHYVYKKQSGGKGLWARVMLDFEPSDGEFQFYDKLSGEGIPIELRPSIEDGLRYESSVGVNGYPPLTGFSVTLVDGETHPVDSNKLAFEMAARMALREASQENLKVLEPVMKLRIVTIEDYVGRISGDISNKRGSILEVNRLGIEQGGQIRIELLAEAPLGELFNYVNSLRSMTSGQVNVNYSFSRYVPLPVYLEEKILLEFRKG